VCFNSDISIFIIREAGNEIRNDDQAVRTQPFYDWFRTTRSSQSQPIRGNRKLIILPPSTRFPELSDG